MEGFQGLLETLPSFLHNFSIISNASLGSFFGQFVAGPAALLTLVAGIVMVLTGGLNFSALWILWGFAGIVGSIALGVILIRPVNQKLTELTAAPSADEARIRQLQRRLVKLNLVNLGLLLSVVYAMVFKPSL
jgi:hypothetical protein